MPSNINPEYSNEPVLQADTYDVIIVGAGWSGLACAVTLAHQGQKVCLLESARHAGGRARQVQFKHFLSQQAVDNGQHIMLGAYHETQALFKLLGLNEQLLLERQPLNLNMFSPEHSPVQLKVPAVFAPLHLLLGFLLMKGVSFTERLAILKMTLSLALSNYRLDQDISVAALLDKHAQSQLLSDALWEPLCLATLNTPIEYASAQVFLRVLKDSFSRQRQDSDLLFFRQDLSETLVRPAINFISRHNGQFKAQNKVLNIDLTDNNSDFIVSTRTQQYQCHTLVLATPAYITEKLLKQQPHLLRPDSASLSFNYEPICTVYLQYPPATRLPETMTGLFNTTAQWLIDRSICTQPGLFAVIISGPGKHLKKSHAELAQLLHHELSLSVTSLPDFLSYQVIIEKRATFSCHVGIEKQRPKNNTVLKGLYIAGDYTDTHYPATLEGAIKSGCTAATKIIQQKSRRHFTL